jgi:hypothetical protein
MCDDDCPACGTRHISPDDSDDLAEIVNEDNGQFAVLVSPETAEHNPAYREVARFATEKLANEFLEARDRFDHYE